MRKTLALVFASLVLLVGMDLVANEIYDCDESGCYSEEGGLDDGVGDAKEVGREHGVEFNWTISPPREVYRPLRPTFCWEDLLFGRGFCAYFGGFAAHNGSERESNNENSKQ
jgi:hypothetical protein